MTVITLTAGTAFIMWLGEQITERGIGNGISLIIFAGIVVRLPSAIANTFRLLSTGEINIFAVLLLVCLMLAVMLFKKGSKVFFMVNFRHPTANILYHHLWLPLIKMVFW